MPGFLHGAQILGEDLREFGGMLAVDPDQGDIQGGVEGADLSARDRVSACAPGNYQGGEKTDEDAAQPRQGKQSHTASFCSMRSSRIALMFRS